MYDLLIYENALVQSSNYLNLNKNIKEQFGYLNEYLKEFSGISQLDKNFEKVMNFADITTELAKYVTFLRMKNEI